MQPNPYESPRESGYDLPIDHAWRNWVRDRIALVITAALIQATLLSGTFLYAWLKG